MNYRFLKSCALCLLAFVALSNVVSAQPFAEKNKLVSIGYGFGNFTQALFSTVEQSYDDYNYTSIGPVFAKFEYGIGERSGIGVNIAYLMAKAEYVDKSITVGNTNTYYKATTSFSTTSVLVRYNVHFGNSEKFDPFLGLGLGYRSGRWVSDDNDPDYDASFSRKNVFPVGMDLTLGARYYFTPIIGAYIEAGMAKGLIQFGVTGRF